MKRHFVIFTLVALYLQVAALGNDSINNSIHYPFSITENKGQITDQLGIPRKDVLFGGTSNGMSFFLRNNGISYQLNRIDTWNEKALLSSSKKVKVPGTSSIYRIDVNWLGANKDLKIEYSDKILSNESYYGKNGAQNALVLNGLTFKNVYDNIHFHLYEKDGDLKYDFIVEPYGDYTTIKLKIDGAEKIEKMPDGSLNIHTPFGIIKEGVPVVIQNNKILRSRWVIKESVLSFEIDGYQPGQKMIIDPLTRAWGTFYGGSNTEMGAGCCYDKNGNVFIFGLTYSSNNIATSGAFLSTLPSQLMSSFLAKFNSLGVRQWCTYYDGGDSGCNGISPPHCSTDKTGAVYMAGFTDVRTGIATPGSHQPTMVGLSCSCDAYLVKFDGAGTRQWCTYYGGSGEESAYSCATDENNNVYMIGYTESVENIKIATPGSHKPFQSGNFRDAYLVKFNQSGVRLWGTYYGCTGWDNGQFVCTSKAGDVFIVGTTNDDSNYQPSDIATPGAFQPLHSGGTDAYKYEGFVAKFNSSGVRQWGTFYGGNKEDYINGACCDTLGNLFIIGQTYSNNFLNFVSPGAHQSSYTYTVGGYAAFMAKFSSSGQRLWGTFYRGNGEEKGNSCAADREGNVYFTGYSTSTISISTQGTWQDSLKASYGFLTKFSPTGTRLWATYCGGAAIGCAVDSAMHIYVSGDLCFSGTGTLVATPGCHQFNPYGGSDAFLMKFDQVPIDLNVMEDQINKPSYNVYPNPFHSKFEISPKPEQKILVYNILGELILRIEKCENIKEIDMTERPNGIYFVRIGSETKKIIKN